MPKEKFKKVDIPTDKLRLQKLKTALVKAELEKERATKLVPEVSEKDTPIDLADEVAKSIDMSLSDVVNIEVNEHEDTPTLKEELSKLAKMGQFFKNKLDVKPNQSKSYL